MKARPILFKPDMVNAILEGRKTQTRRIVKPQPPLGSDSVAYNPSYFEPDRGWYWRPHGGFAKCPYGARGDVLWVREAWMGPLMSHEECMEYWRSGSAKFETPKYCQYAADGGPRPEYMDADDNLRQGWKPSIHMPRWASRLTLEITGVRVERLQDISEDDARAEGARLELAEVDSVRLGAEASHRSGFQNLWKSINGEESWAANPWVWVVEFQPHHTNVDAFLRGREVA